MVMILQNCISNPGYSAEIKLIHSIADWTFYVYHIHDQTYQLQHQT